LKTFNLNEVKRKTLVGFPISKPTLGTFLAQNENIRYNHPQKSRKTSKPSAGLAPRKSMNGCNREGFKRKKSPFLMTFLFAPSLVGSCSHKALIRLARIRKLNI
jgi:hypothetical protein